MQRWMYLEVWRWLYFCAGMLPLHYLCTLLVHLVYVAGERQLFTVHHALYFAVSLRVSVQLPIPQTSPSQFFTLRVFSPIDLRGFFFSPLGFPPIDAYL